jgi:hypothetical protein
VEGNALLCDRALADLDSDAVLRSALAAHDAAQAYGKVREFAILATSEEPVSYGTLATSRLAMAHALNEGGSDGE